jgi:hypothetical protein
MNVPFRCPVCGGCGTVPPTFYEHHDGSTTAVTTRESCRSCGGVGIVWGEDEPIDPLIGLTDAEKWIKAGLQDDH